MRRCGKSSLLQTIEDELIDWGVHTNNIIYLDLDKKEHRKVKTADQLEQLIENQMKNSDKLNYLFIDEVQNVTGFEEVLNGFRTDGGVSIFITGSNSFNRYILEGGFPRTVLIDEPEAKQTYIAGVIQEIFEKDIKKG